MNSQILLAIVSQFKHNFFLGVNYKHYVAMQTYRVSGVYGERVKM